jgi:hypothetical protein
MLTFGLPVRRMLALCGLVLLASVAVSAAQSPELKTYQDVKHGVSFSYPPAWKVVKRAGSFGHAGLLADDSLHRVQPPVILEFNRAGYGKTILEALDFVYLPVLAKSEAECTQIGNVGEGTSPDQRMINGLAYMHSSGGGSSAGHGIDVKTYTTYRHGLCLMFEEEFSTVPGMLGNDGVRDLTPAELKALQRRLDSVMLTVRIEPPVPGTLRSYLDPETGVSIRYPSAWKAGMGVGYGNEPLTDETTANPNPPKARLHIGWMFPVERADPGTPTLEQVDFAYAVLPETTPDTCRKAFDDWASDGSDEVVAGGITFHHVSFSEAGLSHSWSVELYSTFNGGRCLGFSVGDQIEHPDDKVPFSKADRAVSTDADAVFRSLRLLPVKQP